jgi:membrane protease YdiL (CAAX protease family)
MEFISQAKTGISAIVLLWLEFLILFLVLPAILYILAPLPVLPILWIFAVVCTRFLYKDSSFDRINFWHSKAIAKGIHKVLLQFGILAVFIFIVIYSIAPNILFTLMKQRPLLWIMIMILYPLLSVYPQEIIYRTFFFHRYNKILHKKWLLILASGLLFGYMHIIFHNWIAVIMSTIGGILFALTYHHSKSTLLVSIEHALFGCLIFTIGLGQFFYIGSISTIPQILIL